MASEAGGTTKVLGKTITRDEAGVTVPTRVDAGGGGTATEAAPGAAFAALVAAIGAAIVAGRGLLLLR